MKTQTMPHTFTRPFRVRAYECDMLGHLNNAVNQSYCEQAAVEASEDAGSSIVDLLAEGVY